MVGSRLILAATGRFAGRAHRQPWVANVAGAYLDVPVLVAGREIVAYLRHRKQPPAGLTG
jgi:hypothetical protein